MQISKQKKALEMCTSNILYITPIKVAVDPYAVRYRDVQILGLVVVFGRKRVLQPVVDVDTPRGVGLPQLVKFPKVSVGQTNTVGLTVFLRLHFPVMLARLYTGVT